MVVSCTTPSPPHLVDMTDLFNTTLPCQTNREHTPTATTIDWLPPCVEAYGLSMSVTEDVQVLNRLSSQMSELSHLFSCV